MPKARYFTVTQERKVKIRTDEPINAARIADAAFKQGEDASAAEGIEGQVLTQIEVTDMVIREDL